MFLWKTKKCVIAHVKANSQTMYQNALGQNGKGVANEFKVHILFDIMTSPKSWSISVDLNTTDCKVYDTL